MRTAALTGVQPTLELTGHEKIGNPRKSKPFAPQSRDPRGAWKTQKDFHAFLSLPSTLLLRLREQE